MKSCISIYPGIGIEIKRYLDYLDLAKKNKINFAFVSLHIPEANKNLMSDFMEILNRANELDIKVIADISKKAHDAIDWGNINLYGLRLDYGFSIKEMVELSKNNRFKVYLNASTIDEKTFSNMEDNGIALKNIGVFHNFYPKPFTGLSKDSFYEKNNFFKSKGIEIMAFVASHNEPRMPLYKGLPTIENHRNEIFVNQLNELMLMKTDIACIGDSFGSTSELSLMKNFQESEETVYLQIREQYTNDQEFLKEKIYIKHKSRNDTSEYVLRSENSRSIASNKTDEISPFNTVDLKFGDVTIDNLNYMRYCGEINVWLKNAKNEGNVNVLLNVWITEWMVKNANLVKNFVFINGE